jgi:hypothetical protein
MKRVVITFISILTLASALTAVAWAASCPAWTKCPLDGAQALLVTTEYEGITAIGVYEHTTTTGQVHRFRMRCN